MGNASSSVTRIVARLASLGLDDASNAFLQDSFRQFGIHLTEVE